jgi:hypothetical protein
MPSRRGDLRLLRALLAPAGGRAAAESDRRIHYVELRDERRGERCDVRWDERCETRRVRRSELDADDST